MMEALMVDSGVTLLRIELPESPLILLAKAAIGFEGQRSRVCRSLSGVGGRVAEGKSY
tara:strand:+ start:1466 stop:1639 length:174 start_codon:yes stop_codon:yes gene_type:complete